MTGDAPARWQDGGMELLKRAVGPILVATVLVAPVFAYLLTPAPDLEDDPLAQGRAGSPLEARGLLFSNGDLSTRVLPLWPIAGHGLASAERVDLPVATDSTTPTVVGAELRLGSCVFRLVRSGVVRDGDSLHLQRQAPCTDDHSTSGELAVSIRGPGALFLWASQTSATDASGSAGLSLNGPDSTGQLWMLRGRIQRRSPPAGLSRLDLLAWLWDVSAIEVQGRFGMAYLLTIAGLWLLSYSGSASGSARIWRAGLGAGATALSVTLLWSTIMPPLQSADGVDHLLSFGTLATDRLPEHDIRALARRVHFERMRFHHEERFRPAHVRAPHHRSWSDDVHAEQMNARSPITARLWTLVEPLAVGSSPVRALERLQWFNGLVFTLVVALSAALLTSLAPRHGAWLLAGAGLMPTLTYTATMLSDWALMSAWALLTSAGCLLMMTASSHQHVAGAVLGTGLMLLVGTGMSGFTVMPVVIILTGAWILGGGRESGRLNFWAGLGLSVGLVPLILGSLSDVGFQRHDADKNPDFAFLLGFVNALLSMVAHNPLLLLLPLLALAMIDRLWAPVRCHTQLQNAFAHLGRIIAACVALTAMAQLVWSVVVPLPLLPTLESAGFISHLDYLRNVLEVALSGARLARFDHLTFTSLWGGFGWLDAILPETALRVIVLSLVTGIVMLRLTPHPQLRGLGLMALAGGVIALAVLAEAAWQMKRNLHGRYMLPMAVVVTVLTMAAAGAAISDCRRRLPAWFTAVLLAAVHGTSLLTCAIRYFD